MEPLFELYYCCPECQSEWIEMDEEVVDDECPECGRCKVKAKLVKEVA